MVLTGTDISIDKNGNPDQWVLVLAVTHKRFADWCRSHNLNPTSRQVKFVRGVNDLIGIRSAWIKDLGTTQARGEELYSLIDQQVRSGRLREIP